MSNFNWLSHGGPGSGRYPKGSGDRPYQHGFRFGFKSKKKRKVSGVADSPLKGTSKVTNIEKKSKKGPSAGDIEKFGKKVSEVQNTTRTISSNVETISKHLRNAKYGKKNRAKHLTDDELRDAINRIQLEKRYNELTTPQKSDGYDKAMAALAIIGSVAAIAGTGISIASGIKKMRN